MNRINCVLKYLINRRIDEYEQVLKYAKESNYKAISLVQYISGNFKKNDKLLILRHDIDHVTKATEMMIEIEKKYDCNASYYFRDCTADIDLINEVKYANSEASMHFETIANFIKNRRLSKKNFKSEYIDLCKNLLKYELNAFRIKYNLECKTIASHGEYINRIFGISNNVLTEDIESYKFYNIDLEAYNESFIKQINMYISDCPIEINEGYRYGISPIKAIEKGVTPILFLTHPNHWYYNYFQQFKKLVKVILYGTTIKKDSFKRINNEKSNFHSNE